MSTRRLFLGLAVLGLAVGGCEKLYACWKLSKAEFATADAEFKKRLLTDIQLGLAALPTTPPDPCNGRPTCSGADPNNTNLVCRECDPVCTGKAKKPTDPTDPQWDSDDDTNCPFGSVGHEVTLKFSVNVAQIAGASFLSQFKSASWRTATTKVKLGALKPNGSGQDPAYFINWRDIWSTRVSSSVSTTVTGTKPGTSDAISESFTHTIEFYADGLDLCSKVEAGETCDPHQIPPDDSGGGKDSGGGHGSGGGHP